MVKAKESVSKKRLRVLVAAPLRQPWPAGILGMWGRVDQ